MCQSYNNYIGPISSKNKFKRGVKSFGGVYGKPDGTSNQYTTASFIAIGW
jgi:hypothetical protein